MNGPLVWLAVATGACGAIGAAYLPPRGGPRDTPAIAAGAATGAPTAERRRANALAREWRDASLALRLHVWRRQLAPELDRRRATAEPTVVTSVDSVWPPDVRAGAARAVAAAWEALAIGTTKIGVAVVIEPERLPAAVAMRSSVAYLLPDSLDRHTCVVWVEPAGFPRALLERPGERHAQALAAWTRRVLGPCAFYARFGRPGREIERWLAARQHRFALVAAWDSQTARDEPWIAQPETAAERAAWARWARQQLPAAVLGCLAARPGACRQALLKSVPAAGVAPALVAPTPGGSADLPGATWLLTDMVREFGPARFGRFWSADLEADSAFRLATDSAFGDWVWSRLRAQGTTLEAGPAPSWLGGAFGLGLAAVAFGFAAALATRRQVG